jgi:hypothetical protein
MLFSEDRKEFSLANIQFTGAALGAWFDITDQIDDIHDYTFIWDGQFYKDKNGSIEYTVPQFQYDKNIDEVLFEACMQFDKVLQTYLKANAEYYT